MNNLTTAASSPFTSEMSSKDIADVASKDHFHIMRDIRNMIEEGAITESNFGCSEYKDASGKMNPMYVLDFHATMVLITGYDVKRRSLVIDRWMQLETGKAVPIVANSAIDAMAHQLIEMVIPAVVERASKAIVGQIAPVMNGLGEKMDGVYSHFGQYSSISAFYHVCCTEAGYSTRIVKDEIYDAYCRYCMASQCTPYAKTTFCGYLYRAMPGVGKATVTIDGRRIPALHGINLLEGWEVIVEDTRRERIQREERRLASRRSYYFGIDDTEV